MQELQRSCALHPALFGEYLSILTSQIHPGGAAARFAKIQAAFHDTYGVANMLAVCGIDKEDWEIALGMQLPYLFEKEHNVYLGGPMLQSAKWFNLYLPSIGFSMTEKKLSRKEVPSYLSTQKTAMIGVSLALQEKHAIIYQGRRGEQFLFWNNKWQNSDDPNQFCWTADELIRRLDRNHKFYLSAALSTFLPGSCRAEGRTEDVL